jgi:hypothetical protein
MQRLDFLARAMRPEPEPAVRPQNCTNDNCHYPNYFCDVDARTCEGIVFNCPVPTDDAWGCTKLDFDCFANRYNCNQIHNCNLGTRFDCLSWSGC